MAIDTPATIAIVGAGPIGLEAALYARFLGYDVLIFDKGEVADHVRQWGHVTMFSPFEMNRSALGLAALAAQDDAYTPPSDDEFLSGQDWVARYLLPLAETDLLNDCLRLHCQVRAISRTQYLKQEAVGDPERGDDEFRIFYTNSEGQEAVAAADIVIDASGVFSQPNWLGPGGAPAVGERQLEANIQRRLPDVLGDARESFAGRRTLVVGDGYSAATTIASLARLRTESPGTEIFWVTRSTGDTPIARIENDRLESRDTLARMAAQAAANGDVQWIPGEGIEAITAVSDAVSVRLASGRTLEVDEVVSQVGYRVDSSLYSELQVHQCYATEGPMKLAAAMLADGNAADCLEQTSHGAASLCTTEPNFYILGAKSYGRNSQFLVQTGLRQIKELFTLIGDRETLDLYATIKIPSQD